MPASTINAAVRRYKMSRKRAEGFWRDAKEQYGEDWQKVNGTFWKICRNWARSKGR